MADLIIELPIAWRSSAGIDNYIYIIVITGYYNFTLRRPLEPK
jgi:hypothetical protein